MVVHGVCGLGERGESAYSDPYRPVRVGDTVLVKFVHDEQPILQVAEPLRKSLQFVVDNIGKALPEPDFLAIMALHLPDGSALDQVSRFALLRAESNLVSNAVAFTGGPLLSISRWIAEIWENEVALCPDDHSSPTERPTVNEGGGLCFGDEREFYDQPDFLAHSGLPADQVELLRRQLANDLPGPTLMQRIDALSPVLDSRRSNQEIIKSLRKALDWVFEARAQHRDAMAFVCYWFAIESLVRGPDREHASKIKTKDMKERILCTTAVLPPECAFLTKDFLNTLYESRCRMVHNGMMIPGRDDEAHTYDPFSLVGTNYLEGVTFILRRVFAHMLDRARSGEQTIAGAWKK